MQIVEAVDLFLGDVKGRYEEHTLRTYNNALKRFMDYLEEREAIKPTYTLKKITGRITRRFPGWLSNQYAPSTAVTYSHGVGRWINWLLDEEITTITEADKRKFDAEVTQIARSKPKRLPKPFDPGVVERIREALEYQKPPIQERNAAILAFMLETGCRVSEMVNLRVADIDLENGRARVIGKGNKERIVFITPATGELIQAYWTARGYREEDAPLFSGHSKFSDPKKHSPISTSGIRYVIDQMAKFAGFDPGDIYPHRFRHTFATIFLQKSGNVALTQAMLGHASPETTMIYAEITGEDKEKAFQEVFGEH